MRILNLTSNRATPEQIADGVIDLHDHHYQQLCDLLAFSEIPTAKQIRDRVIQIAALAYEAESHLANDVGIEIRHPGNYIQRVMIGRAPFLITELSTILSIAYGYRVRYEFSLHTASDVLENVMSHLKELEETVGIALYEYDTRTTEMNDDELQEYNRLVGQQTLCEDLLGRIRKYKYIGFVPSTV